MDDELENFIREHKARMAEDKASLEQDPPYMEIKAKPHRAYESTAKENIPPRSIAQEKEESCTVGLPLGVEYERKKQRLQHELRMDYRRYMAQKKHFGHAEPGPLIRLNNRRSIKQHLLENQAGVLPKQRPPSRRDAATLTEDSRGPHRALRLAEVKTLCPDTDQERSTELPRHCDRQGKPLDQDSEEEEEGEEEEEEEYFKELELMEGRRRRHIGVEASYEKRRFYKTDGREQREILVGRGSRALTNNEDVEFATGLKIGAADTEDALQRRKERYRQELQEQIAEQHRNKKREKDMELKVAATGANDPEKQVSRHPTTNSHLVWPDRIRQFGLCRRETHQFLEPSATGESETSSRGLPHNVKMGVRDRETPLPPPEQPHVAFQSPLLEYSSALSLGGGGLSPHSQPAAPSFPRATDTPRIPLFPPHPPSALSEAYRSPYGEPHHYYGTRNLLDPNMAYYGHLSVPPVSYWNVPAGGSLPSQFGNHSPHSQHSGSSFPEPPIMPSSEAATVDSHIRVFPSDRSRSSRERIVSYREALKQQIQQQQEQRRLDREEKERYEAQLEADMKNHQPWGRGGGGAPLRDSAGNLIADLNQMHKLNEEAYINPEQWQRRATASVTARRAELPDPNERVSGTVAECSSHDTSERLSGFTHVQTPQFARGNVFPNQPTQQQLNEQDKYKAYLKQQIDEKMLKKAEEREQIRLEEEKEEKRLAEQRARIQREFDEEQERKKRKEMEQKAKNEELIQLAEQRKKEMERKKNEAEENERAALRRRYEMERQARVEEVYREPSPPIPTLQKRHGLHQYTPRPPSANSQHSTAPLSERSLSGLQSPPVPARRNQLRAAGDQRDLFSELSALRRHLRSEEKRLEGRLQQVDWEELDSPLSDRSDPASLLLHRERPQVDVFDMARLRLQAPVRRPNSRNTEPRNLQRIHDSLQLKCTDAESRLGFREVPKQEEVGVAGRRRRGYSDLPFSSQRSTVQDDYCDLSPPQQNDYLRSVMGRSARGSLLASESAFIDPLGEAFPERRTPEQEKAPMLSARERRRLSKRPQHPQDRASSSRPFGQQDDYSALTGDRQEAEPRGERGSRDRSGRLMSISRRSNAAGPADLSDAGSSPPRFSLHSHNRRGSVETPSTDIWMRPGTLDKLKCLDRPSRRERLAT
ncbi:centrosome and spindle pole associated protein 1-like isoform X3 [Anoplopoma fimbria]|nr:centrosome and spindle pole associated protein 1-like isoform X3 [Anoplopoma fimbria]XP_054453961.1 centrosome and spindle pole associated protein 1-like isoform X3 [Anoplopoma fimbria]